MRFGDFLVALSIALLQSTPGQEDQYMNQKVHRNGCGLFRRIEPITFRVYEAIFEGIIVQLMGRTTHPLPKHVCNTSCVMFKAGAEKGHLVAVIEYSSMSLRKYNDTFIDFIKLENDMTTTGPLCGNMKFPTQWALPQRIGGFSRTRDNVDLKVVFTVFKDCPADSEPKPRKRCGGYNYLSCISSNLKCNSINPSVRHTPSKEDDNKIFSPGHTTNMEAPYYGVESVDHSRKSPAVPNLLVYIIAGVMLLVIAAVVMYYKVHKCGGALQSSSGSRTTGIITRHKDQVLNAEANHSPQVLDCQNIPPITSVTPGIPAGSNHTYGIPSINPATPGMPTESNLTHIIPPYPLLNNELPGIPPPAYNSLFAESIPNESHEKHSN